MKAMELSKHVTFTETTIYQKIKTIIESELNSLVENTELNIDGVDIELKEVWNMGDPVTKHLLHDIKIRVRLPYH